jgi:hypothetical protein
MYKVTFRYKYNKKIRRLNWNFTTKSKRGIFKYKGKALKLRNNRDNYIYITPENRRDVIKTISYSCNSKLVKIKIHSPTMLKVTTGRTSKKSQCKIIINRSKKILFSIK